MLQTARLQVDALGEPRAALIVEGAGDRKLFAPLCFSSSQVVIAGGKSLVLGAHAAMREDDIGRFAFLVDCDGDVGPGGLRGGLDLVITEHSDVEGDLLAMGALDLVVEQLVPAVTAGEKAAAQTSQLLSTAMPSPSRKLSPGYGERPAPVRFRLPPFASLTWTTTRSATPKSGASMKRR